jgi:hypothetical protein
LVATTSVVLVGDGHEIVICDGHEIVAGDGHVKSVGFLGTHITSFPEVVWRIDSGDLRVPHEVGGIPVSVIRVRHLPPEARKPTGSASCSRPSDPWILRVLAICSRSW